MNPNHVILFDGVCNLCDGFVNFVIDHDHHNQFKFASLQSDFGQQVLQQNNLSTKELSSIVLLTNQTILLKSTAVLTIFRLMGGRISLLYSFIVLPTFMRDMLYDVVAKNRYILFGKQHECRLPTPALKQKFLL